MNTNQQKKVVLINPSIIEILYMLLMVCYFLLRFDILLIICMPVLFIVYLILRGKQEKAKRKKPNPDSIQRQIFLSSILIFVWSLIFLMQSIGRYDFRFTLEVLLSGITLTVIVIIIVFNMHNQNKLWEQERIDSESFVEE